MIILIIPTALVGSAKETKIILEAWQTVISNSDEGYKDMDMGQLNAGKMFIDATGNRQDQVLLNETGWGRFPVNAGSLSVWIESD